MTVEVTQFFRPRGRSERVFTQLSDDLQEPYEKMSKAGCRFEAEVLDGGMVSITISDSEDDLDARIKENGPKVQKAMEEMLRTEQWKRVLESRGEED